MYGRTSLISVLVLLFGAVVFAQTDQCPKINIHSREYLHVGEILKASASFENETQPSASKFDWIIITERDPLRVNGTFRIKESGIIEIESKSLTEGGTITLLAESADKRCPEVAVKKVVVIVPVGDPVKIDEYSNLAWNDEKTRLDVATVNLFSMGDNKDLNLFIFISYKKGIDFTKLKDRITKIFNHLAKYRKVPENSLTFVLDEFENESTSFMILPRDREYCDASKSGCLVIRGGDFEKLEKLFQTKQDSKRIANNSKRRKN